MAEDQDQADASTSTITATPDASVSPSDAPPTEFRASPSPDPSTLKGAALAVPTIVDAPSDASPVENEQQDERQDVGEGSSESPAVKEDIEMGKEEEEPVVEAVMLQGAINEKDEEWWYLKMTWSGKVFDLKVGSNDMVYDFREQIHQLTSVPPVRQKVIGLAKGKLAAELDSTRFGTLGVKKDCKFTMIGTPESDTFKDPSDVKATILDNFDVNYTGLKRASGNVIAPADDPRNKRMIETLVKKIPITVMNEPRPGKKLLVLDLDYTMVDSKPLLAGSLPPEECARPGLHDFLERVYPHYDIVVWSQTGWRWLESKLVELGVIGGDRNYKISFVSDRTTMFPVFTQRNGQVFKHEVKPLAYFWASYPHWSAKNTVHIDDLGRNFAMNPGEGLKIRAFNMAGQHSEYQSTTNYRPDRELYKLAAYLCKIAEQEDFTTIDHSKWKKTLGPGDQ